MSEPSDFHPSTLGEVSRPRQWPTISQNVIESAGLYPVYGANGVIGFYIRYTHDTPTVAITCRGSTCGEVHLTPEKSYITGNAMALDDLDTSRLNQRYLYHYLKWDGLKDCVTGSAQPQIIGSALKSFVVWHPESSEQNLIATILDTLDTQIQQTEALIAKLEKVKEGLLHDLLTRGIDENGRLRPSPEQAPELYKESPLGLIPREWDVCTLSEIASTESGCTPSRSLSGRYFNEDGIPWVKTLDLNEGEIYKTKEAVTSAALKECSFRLMPVNTVLIAMYGGWEQIGRTAILKSQATTNQAITSILCKGEVINPEFLLIALQFLRPRWRKVAASTRKDPNITSNDVRQFEVATPQRLKEQSEIVYRLDTASKKISSEVIYLEKLMQKKLGLMDDLLTGRVRVTPLLDQAQATTPA